MKETAIFGGGCFWCTEAVFQSLHGVMSVTSGYARGRDVHDDAKHATHRAPTYEEVSSGTTGYAEVICIEFDPAKIDFTDLLTVFFASHDPTTKNRQGADVGTQYRSIVLYTTETQKKSTHAFIEMLNVSSAEGAPIVTEVAPLDTFFPAESYHQNFYKNNPENQYCEIVINPKLKKVQEQFGALLKRNEASAS